VAAVWAWIRRPVVWVVAALVVIAWVLWQEPPA